MTRVDDIADAAPRLGRKRDHTRDPEILDATLEILSESGYDAMTIDMVAARAKAGKATVYRRWSSKEELVIDAVACMKSRDLDLDALPDTGTLRGDLVAMVKSPTIRESEQKLRIMSGIAAMIARSPELAETVRETLFGPRIAANRVIFQRAIDRGEIPADSDIDTLCVIGSAMVTHRVLVLGLPTNREYMIGIIDRVILPAAGVRAGA